MEITGIIAEYNPLHQGHLYHIQKTRELLHPDVLIILVSSYFSQRALPSLLSPRTKAKLALQAGADLVLELPSVYAAQSADKFALYSIEALKTAGVTSIVFGSETNDLHWLEECADKLEQLEKNPATSLARNMEEAMGMHRANDILGVQYVRWCRQFGIRPYTIKREDSYISATQTRNDFFEGKNAWLSRYFIREQNWDNYYPYLRLYLQLSDARRLQECFLVSEGIEHRLKKMAMECESWPEFLEACITRTYTRARIQRTCLFLLLQIGKAEMEEHASFFALCLLGFSMRGQEYLKSLPKETPVYSRFRDLPEFLQKVELKSRLLYTSVMPKELLPLDTRIVIERNQRKETDDEDAFIDAFSR